MDLGEWEEWEEWEVWFDEEVCVNGVGSGGEWWGVLQEGVV